jgi:NADH-quinone oxidoreductase subunit C
MIHSFSIINKDNVIIYNPNQSITNDLNNKFNIVASRQEARQLSAFLKMHSLTRVTNAIDISVVDHINNELRFNITYHLQSLLTNTRYSLSIWVSESKPILSLQTIYSAFNWAEREIWDMYGIFIAKHPDLRRILTDYGFEGYPLRKDFPLSGFKEIQFEDIAKQVEYINTELTQSYRLLSYSNPWSDA